jgi:hypothetical protein
MCRTLQRLICRAVLACVMCHKTRLHHLVMQAASPLPRTPHVSCQKSLTADRLEHARAGCCGHGSTCGAESVAGLIADSKHY